MYIFSLTKILNNFFKRARFSSCTQCCQKLDVSHRKFIAIYVMRKWKGEPKDFDGVETCDGMQFIT